MRERMRTEGTRMCRRRRSWRMTVGVAVVIDMALVMVASSPFPPSGPILQRNRRGVTVSVAHFEASCRTEIFKEIVNICLSSVSLRGFL
jgi:hypothetical protein